MSDMTVAAESGGPAEVGEVQVQTDRSGRQWRLQLRSQAENLQKENGRKSVV